MSILRKTAFSSTLNDDSWPVANSWCVIFSSWEIGGFPNSWAAAFSFDMLVEADMAIVAPQGDCEVGEVRGERQKVEVERKEKKKGKKKVKECNQNRWATPASYLKKFCSRIPPLCCLLLKGYYYFPPFPRIICPHTNAHQWWDHLLGMRGSITRDGRSS